MEEDLKILNDSAKNCNKSVTGDEKVKDFVFKHFREVADGALFNNAEDSSIKEHGSPIRKEKTTMNRGHCKIQQGAVFSGKILSFGCSVCKNDCRYSPNDLLKHFRAAHKGTLPTYPCDLCGFVTNEFPALQRHRIEHRNTLVTCELCDNDVQYSLLLLTRHYIMCHSLNGQFTCDWCDFTTVDAGTFVQHIHHHNESPWKCSKCRHISLNEEDHHKHMKAHSGTFPYTCQICGYGSARSEYLKKHTAAVHKEEAERRNVLKTLGDSGSPANASASLKLLLKKSCESQEAQRISKLNCLSGSFSNQNGRLIKPEISVEETHHFVDSKKENKNMGKGSHYTEQSIPIMLQECDNSASSDAASHTSPNGLTVLMVKNKISLPPNCTTKVMGFKMVDGKKHLVLKVIPTTKQDLSTQNHSFVEDLGSSTPSLVLEKRVPNENGECSNSRNSTSHSLAFSPRSESCLQMDQGDIMAVKVKIEEEETSVSNHDSPARDDGEQTPHLVGRSSTWADTLYPVTNEFDHVDDQVQLREASCSERSAFHHNSVTLNCDATCRNGSQISYTSNMCTDMVTDLSSPSKDAEEISAKRFLKETIENCGASNELLMIETGTDKFSDNVENDDQCSQSTSEESNVRMETQHKNDRLCFKKLLTTPAPSSESSSYASVNTHNSPNQDVFHFHNYSKETHGTSPNNTQSFDTMSDPSADQESICKSSHIGLTLVESPELFTERGKDSTQEKVSESDINECIASVDDSATEEEHPESVLQDFNIIKIEEESIPISNKQSDTQSSSNSLGTFVEEHSDAIITQQLHRERVGSSGASNDSLKQTKTALRILQLPEGKQSVLLRTSENRFAVPVQVNAPPGFKLITNSANPQINVSYMRPGFERSGNPAGGILVQNGKRAGTSEPKAGASEKGTTPSAGTTSNHYLINSPGFKGPLLLSSTPHNTPTDKTVQTAPTCYLVQRSVPFVQTPSAPGLRLASTQFQLNSKPVLAMPVSPSEKPSTLQTGHQAFLLRYISPPKSNVLSNNQDTKNASRCSQTSESTGNKVIFKLVTPTSSHLTSCASTASSQPLFLASRPQTQCFLVASNKTTSSTGVKKLIPLQNTAHKDVNESYILPSRMNVMAQMYDAEKPMLAPRPIRPPSQRKRRRKALFDELPTPVHKVKRLSNKALTEKETTVLWKPTAKEVERTLRLAPFNSLQLIKCPRRYQPVVVLNHPDGDIPEVANIMKIVNRHKGVVTKVSLSPKTIQALSELCALQKNSSTKGAPSYWEAPKPRPIQSSVRERFLLKLKLRRKSKKKYQVVDTRSGCREEPAAFDCWFCGRLFGNQEDWIGHGQRHLMEATRDWNKLF
ncbi:znf518a [Pungitius sinensis]